MHAIHSRTPRDEPPLHPLDVPVWSSLSTLHAPLALAAGPARRYPKEIGPFIALPPGEHASAAELEALVDAQDEVFLLGQTISAPTGWLTDYLGDLLQMHCVEPPKLDRELAIQALTEPHHKRDVRELTALVYPHYFRSETMRLGRYFGIYERGRLAAMIGERMGTPAHRELSAVCTHPEFTGRGLARHLFAWLTLDLLAKGQQPFLHVAAQNKRAIDLYEQNGFTVRIEIPFYGLRRQA
ncbi:GNAT family N-acetyltransferase [Ahniella affigens]|uniref:GNAT family N-acetyltransferase n=1 Tax=Ahniella affigens TaxID=2021234 RepID=A0A2P1PPI9_9GAMM|nr:GNAT family N-acetyltransferase [Ahniella affigens]